MKYFKLPDLGEGLAEAEIVEWHVNPGDEVQADQPLVTVETAKAMVEVPSPRAGRIAARFGEVGDIVHTGEPLVEFTDGAEDSGSVVGQLRRAEASLSEDFVIGAAAGSTRPSGVRATPAVRALARRLGIDLALVQPSSPGGLITAEDVERALRLQRERGQAEPLRGVRRVMARTMALSHTEVVPVTLHEDADIHDWPPGTDITIRLILAMGAACRAEPALNAWFDGHTLSRRLLERVDLGIAVDTEDGLFVPVLRDVTGRSPEDLRQGLDRLRADVKRRVIPPEEMQGASITLSNFGTLCGRYATPVVVPPMVAILGAGVVRQEPVARNGELVIRTRLPLSLTFDHRAATGGEAARFMRALIEHLERPEAE